MRDLFAEPEMAPVAVEPNEHGCYPVEQAERLACPNPRKGWRGGPLAGIELLNVAGVGWIFATSTMFPESGHGGPLTRHRVLPSRDQALEMAVADLRGRCDKRLTGPDAKAAQVVVQWLNGMTA